jgi:hypothetical protein
MKTITNYLKQKHPDLPSNWCVYSIRKLDGEGDAIVELVGAIARPLKLGKNKGQLTYDRDKKKFLMSMKEYHLAHENAEVAA